MKSASRVWPWWAIHRSDLNGTSQTSCNLFVNSCHCSLMSVHYPTLDTVLCPFMIHITKEMLRMCTFIYLCSAFIGCVCVHVHWWNMFREGLSHGHMDLPCNVVFYSCAKTNCKTLKFEFCILHFIDVVYFGFWNCGNNCQMLILLDSVRVCWICTVPLVNIWMIWWGPSLLGLSLHFLILESGKHNHQCYNCGFNVWDCVFMDSHQWEVDISDVGHEGQPSMQSLKTCCIGKPECRVNYNWGCGLLLHKGHAQFWQGYCQQCCLPLDYCSLGYHAPVCMKYSPLFDAFVCRWNWLGDWVL